MDERATEHGAGEHGAGEHGVAGSLLPEERAGLVGPLLVAALCDEAARLGVGEIVALAADRTVARYLRSLGFVERPVKRLPVLRVPE